MHFLTASLTLCLLLEYNPPSPPCADIISTTHSLARLSVATPKKRSHARFPFPPSLSGILVNLHHSSAASPSTPETSRSSTSSSRHCGSINTNVVQQVVAAKWATDVINNQSLPYELKIGESVSQ